MIMGDWVWASHEEADDNSKENESQDSSQEQNKQNLKFYIIKYYWSFKRDLLLVFWQGTVSKLWTVVSPNSTATKFLKLIWAPKIMVKLVIPKQPWNFSNCSTKRDGKKEFQSNWIFLKMPTKKIETYTFCFFLTEKFSSATSRSCLIG